MLNMYDHFSDLVLYIPWLSQRVTEAPFSKQQYELFEEELNDSERRVAISYSVDESEPDRRPKTEVEMIKKVQAMEKFTGSKSET